MMTEDTRFKRFQIVRVQLEWVFRTARKAALTEEERQGGGRAGCALVVFTRATGWQHDDRRNEIGSRAATLGSEG